MYGGNLHSTANAQETVDVVGRLAAAGTVTAPVTMAKFTVNHTANSGVYNIVFSEQYAQFLGCQVDLEGSVIPASAAAVASCLYNWTPATRTLEILTWTGTATPVATDVAFSFVAKFSESR